MNTNNFCSIMDDKKTLKKAVFITLKVLREYNGTSDDFERLVKLYSAGDSRLELAIGAILLAVVSGGHK